VGFLRLKGDQGKGRTFILLEPAEIYRPYADDLVAALSERCRVLHYEVASFSAVQWILASDEFIQLMSKTGVRQCSILAFGSCSTLAQIYSLSNLRSIRTLVLVDSVPRPYPGLLERVSDRLEKLLPLGLPMRGSSKGFLGSAFLQRIRCPSLLILSPAANSYATEQFEQMLEGLPTAWGVKMESWGEFGQIINAVLEFQQVPARCPQKNRVAI